jgi:DNA-directed RNA polymerase subunit RPC12/RpoP
MNLYEIISIKFKCPKCGREFDDYGEAAQRIIWSEITCPCGFTGEIAG